MDNEIDNEINNDNNEIVEKMNIKVDVEEKSSCERHVKVEVSREDIEKCFDREYADLQANAAIPGFRPGKAPRKLVEKRFKNDVKDRVKSALLVDSLTQANEDAGMTPISEPDLKLDAIVLPEEGPFVYEYDVEVRPTFDVPNWKGLKLEKPVRQFSTEDVDAAVQRIRANYGELVDKEKEEGAASGDYIVAKLTFKRDGEVVSQAESETIRIRPTLSFHDGSIAGFDKLMEGAKPGDVRETKLTLSEDSADEKLRGKEIDAIFEVNGVKVVKLPELDAEFLQSLGGFENMGDFRDAVLETLERQLDHEQRQRARRQIAEQLTRDANWELPPALLKRQSARELERAVYELRRSGFDDDQIVRQINFLRQNSAATTAQALKEHFILEKIAESEGIEDAQQDYDLEIMLMAAQSGESPRRIRSQIEKSGNMDVLRNQIIERKVIDLIQKSAEFVEVPYEMEAISEEAIDRAAGSNAQEDAIPEVSEEEVKEVARKEAEKK